MGRKAKALFVAAIAAVISIAIGAAIIMLTGIWGAEGSMIARIGVLVLMIVIWFVLIWLFGRIDHNSDAKKDPVTPEQQRYLAFAAPMFMRNADTLHTFDFLSGTKKQIIKVLRDWWGIEDEQSTIETLELLTVGGNHTDFADSVFIDIIKAGHSTPLSLDALNDIDGFEDADESILEEINAAADSYDFLKKQLVRSIKLTEEELLEISTLAAWDYGRAGFIARYSANAGYISRDTAWEYMKIAADNAAVPYSSWRQYFIAYYIGRAIAYGETGEEHVDDLKDILRTKGGKYDIFDNISFKGDK